MIDAFGSGVRSLSGYLGFSFRGTERRDAGRYDVSELAGWTPPPGFHGNDIWGERDAVLGRARDLDKNNAWVNGGLDRRVESVIGGNIRLRAQPSHDLLNRDFKWRMGWTAQVQSRFRVWSNDIERRCDARQTLTMGQITRLAYLGYIRDGECAAEVQDIDRSLPNPTAVLLFEPERISTPQDRGFHEGPKLRSGVVFDDSSAPIGYWVRTRHPADFTPGNDLNHWEYIPRTGPTGRAKLIHVFNPRFAEQNRGFSRLAEAMVPAKMLDRVDRAEVQAALKSAMMSFFIKSPGTTDELEQMLAPTADSTGKLKWLSDYLDYRNKTPVRMDGAHIHHLLPDEDVVTPDATHPNSNYPQFVRFILQKVSAALGISYPQLSQDWAGINYSSARAMLNELWRSFLEDREFFTQQFCTPIYAAWLEYEVANGDIKVPGGPLNFYRNKTAICMAEWIGPGRGSVDPAKEAAANNLDTAAGRKSTVEAILETGRDPVDVIQEEVWFREERANAGLPDVNHNVKPDANAAADGGDAPANDAGQADQKSNGQ